MVGGGRANATGRAREDMVEDGKARTGLGRWWGKGDKQTALGKEASRAVDDRVVCPVAVVCVSPSGTLSLSLALTLAARPSEHNAIDSVPLACRCMRCGLAACVRWRARALPCPVGCRGRCGSAGVKCATALCKSCNVFAKVRVHVCIRAAIPQLASRPQHRVRHHDPPPAIFCSCFQAAMPRACCAPHSARTSYHGLMSRAT